YAVTPFDGIMTQVGTDVTVGYEPGCINHKRLPLLDSSLLLAQGSEEHGFTIEYFNSADLTGESVWSEFYPISELQWFGNLPTPVDTQQFSVRATACFLPRESGEYTFGLLSAGQSRFLVDGQEIIDNWTHQTPGDAYFGTGSTEVCTAVEMQAGREYTLTLEFSSIAGSSLNAMHLGCFPPFPADALERAVRLAANSDVAVICAGLSGEWESEGFDRPDMDLPGDQDTLIASVAAVNKNTVVVLNTGSPISMPWLDQVAAVVQSWYPGQECGNAIADVLFGETAPAGKLTQTWPRRLEDNPAYINYPGENGKVHYGEGLFVGYRYYEKKHITPLFPFGFGLTYTTFEYGELRLSAQEISPNDTLQVEVDITNTGARAGKEIVQLYVRDIQSRLQRPEKELKAFTKVHLEPGERKTVTFELARDALFYYDDLARAWVAEPGEFEVQVGASSQDIRATGKFALLSE
ncbi:MAG TPA: glycoside hydrolase family 3 C-terminal domain-containing protein, partial [Ktedonobacteraceae bacterium]